MRRRQWTLLLGAAATAAALGMGGCASSEVRQAGSQMTAALETAAQGEKSAAAPEASGAEKAAADAEEAAAEEAGQQLAVIEDGLVPLYSKPQGSLVRVPTASGTVTYSNGPVTVDASNTQNGYVMVKYSGSVGKIKVQIAKDGLTYTYDLNARSAYEVFPLSEGSGTYSVKVFEQVQGNSYSQAFSQSVNVSLASEYEPFLYPNQYVNFSGGSAAVSKAAEVAAGAADALGVVNNIYNYVINNTTYDTAKANSVQSGYLPSVDQTLASGTGICFDYAALMVSMLRSQDIPSKLVIGYTGSVYHAWVNVYIDGVGWLDNYIYFDGTNWSLADPTFASTGGQSDSIKQYIGNGANYQQKYCY